MRLRLLAPIALLLLAVAPAEAANQLTNGSFPSNVSGWTIGGLWPVVWTGTEGAAALGAAQVTATSASGSIGALAMSQCTVATAGTAYDFGTKFKIDPTSTQTGGARLRVTWYTGASCTLVGTTDVNSVDATSAVGWQTLAVTNLTAPAGTVSVLVELIQSVNNPGTFQAFWDDVYFGPNPTAVSLVGFTAE